MTQTMTGPWRLRAGDHVCWRASCDDDVDAGHATLAESAERQAGGLLLLGGEHVAPVPARRARAGLRQVREQVLHAARSGRAPWVLAPIGDLTRPDCGAADLIAFELELADLAVRARTAVVCAYHGSAWEPEVLGAVAAVHTQIVGIRPSVSGFRLLANDGSYALEGAVGFESVPAFTAALSGALIRTPRLTLSCRHLDLIEASAMRVLVETVAASPGTSILLEHAGHTVLRTWELSGYAASGVAVKVTS